MPTITTSGTVAAAPSAVRAGMADLISRWRNMVADSGTVAFTDDEAQIILDNYRVDLYRQPLTPVPVNVGGVTQYLTHLIGYGNLETAASGTAYWQIWNANGSAIGTASYSADYQAGIVTFSADTKGSALYLDARSFDLHAAAAHGWREWAGAKASLYKFSADGASYDRHQWFDHCIAMAAQYDRMATIGAASMQVGHMYRGDVTVTAWGD